MLTLGSLFAGIGGFDEGFRRAGFVTRWCVEWDTKCQCVLRRHFPEADIRGDIEATDPATLAPVDVITYGFPCTDISCAGKQKGLKHDDGTLTRSGMFYRAAAIITAIRPRYAVFENVDALLNHDHGRTLAEVLRVLAAGGYGSTQWVTVDSQWFSVAQRRRRVFGISSRETEPDFAAQCARQVQAVAESMRGDSAEGGEAGQDLAPTLEGRAGRSGATNFHTSGGLAVGGGR